MSTGRLGAGDTAIQPTLLDAKGDLIAATAADTPARLAVGANGESLVADSSTATGLRWQGSFEAGKNKIINGDFGIWQRGTSFTPTGGYGYTADRWLTYSYGSSTTTVTRQTFTPGTAPVAGYEGTYFLRVNSSNSQTWIGQRIEDVRVTSGQTVTISYWARTASGTANIGINYYQDFGSGGSTGVNTAGNDRVINTSWARYSTTINVPSISGKTIGTNSYVELAIYTTTLNVNIDYWGIQVEVGSTATPFQTATGTLQGERSACERYYYRTDLSSNTYTNYGVGMSISTTDARVYVKFPTTMRVRPTSIDAANLAISDFTNYTNAATVTINEMNNMGGTVNAASSGMTQYRPAFLVNNNNTTGYLGFSAEL